MVYIKIKYLLLLFVLILNINIFCISVNANVAPDITIENSYFIGSVSGNDYIGGIGGRSYGEEDDFINVYVLANIIGNNDVGGITGISKYDLFNSFFIGNISGVSNVGGIVGDAEYNCDLTNVYYNNNSNNPNLAIGLDNNAQTSNVTQNNMSYYYSSSNEPLASWALSDWNFFSNALPKFWWE